MRAYMDAEHGSSNLTVVAGLSVANMKLLWLVRRHDLTWPNQSFSNLWCFEVLSVPASHGADFQIHVVDHDRLVNNCNS